MNYTTFGTKITTIFSFIFCAYFLADNSLLINKSPGFIETYKYYIIGLAFILMALTFIIIIQFILRLRQKEKLKHLTVYRNLFDNMPIAYAKQRILINDDGEPFDFVIREVNPSFKRDFGMEGDLVGMRGSEIINSFPEVMRMFGKMLGKGEKEIHFQYHHNPTGKTFTAIATWIGHKNLVNIFFMDNTELLNMQRELVIARDKAEEANRLKTAFLANISHEIRTPLNAIVGFSDVLMSADNEAERQEYISIIKVNNNLLLQLVSDVLDISGMESGTLKFAYTDVNVDDLMEELLHMARLKADTKGLAVELKCFTPGLRAHTEKNRVLQVLTNLMLNAVKFTEKGKISIGYRLCEDNTIHFWITDTGKGIPAEKHREIFERFVKLDSFSQGTGLGLPICLMIIEHMGGEIGVESTPGEGSTFWFTIPFVPVETK